MKTSVQMLHIALDAWSAFAGRKLNQQAIDSWVSQFKEVDPLVLGPALEYVTAHVRRMPWPGDLTEAIAIVRERQHFGESAPSWKHTELPDKDSETSKPIVVWQDEETKEKYYRPQDCPEGREFLALTKKLGPKKFSFPTSQKKGGD